MNRKVRIAFYCSSLTKGGAERVFANLAEYFHANGYQVFIVTPYQYENEYTISEGITRIISDLSQAEEHGRVANLVNRYRKLRRIFKKVNADIVFSCNGKNNFMALTANMGMHKKVVVSVIADPKMEYYTSSMRILAKVLFRFADGIVLQTKDAMEYFPKAIQKKSVILPNSLNPKFVKTRFEGTRTKEIVAVGRLDDNKNHAMLLQAFSSIKDNFPEYQITIYGEGEYREHLEILAAKLHLEDRVSLPGQVSELENKIDKATLFVMTSDTEGMPNALIEAMALGLPCISTDCPCGGPRALITHGINGFLVPVRDTKALEKQIEYCLSHLDEMDEVGRKAAALQESMAPDKVNTVWKEYFLRIMGK